MGAMHGRLTVKFDLFNNIHTMNCNHTAVCQFEITNGDYYSLFIIVSYRQQFVY